MFNGIIYEMCALVINQHKWTTKVSKYEFIKETIIVVILVCKALTSTHLVMYSIATCICFLYTFQQVLWDRWNQGPISWMAQLVKKL
jgi:hypothetical protein